MFNNFDRFMLAVIFGLTTISVYKQSNASEIVVHPVVDCPVIVGTMAEAIIDRHNEKTLQEALLNIEKHNFVSEESKRVTRSHITQIYSKWTEDGWDHIEDLMDFMFTTIRMCIASKGVAIITSSDNS